MKFCPKCGTPLGENMKFCPECGNVLNAPAVPTEPVAPAPVQHPAEPIQAQPVQQPVHLQPPVQNVTPVAPKKKSGVNWKVLTILLIVGALIIGAGAAVIVDIVDDGEFNLFGLLDSGSSANDDDDEDEDDETDPTGTTGPAAPVVDADPKAFKVGAMTITLDTRFKEQAASEMLTYLVNEADEVICTVICMGEVQNVNTVDQMATTLKAQFSSSGVSSNVYQKEGITYLVFSVEGGTGFMAVYLSDGIFWTVQFSCEEAVYSKFESQFLNFAKSVKFAPVQKETRYCEYCEEDVVWQSWTSRDSLPAQAGHYRLKNDVTLRKECNWMNLGVMCLDLNGKTVYQTTVGQRIANIRNGVVSIFDSSAEGTGKILPASATEDETVMKWRWAVGFLMSANSELNIYGGTIDCSQVESGGRYGCCVTLDAGTLTIYGGKLIGGTTATPGSGGTAVTVMKDATVNMSGGEIIGGTVPESTHSAPGGGAIKLLGTMYITGGKVVGGTTVNGVGGTIQVRSTGKLYITAGAEIVPGTASEGKGNNIYVEKGGQVTLPAGSTIDVVYEG